MKHKLTQQDIKEIQEELDYRKLVVRPKALEEVKETRLLHKFPFGNSLLNFFSWKKHGAIFFPVHKLPKGV